MEATGKTTMDDVHVGKWGIMKIRNLTYYLVRLASKLKPNAIKGCYVDKRAGIGHGNQLVNCEVGKYSYIGDGCVLAYVKVGAFCFIAPKCTIGGAAHPLAFVSTSPVFCEGRNVLGKNFSRHTFAPYAQVNIGNDVWIGSNCLIKQGVEIGNGAVIGMGSVLTKNVGPYEIWAGNPAKLIRKRFDEETIQKLQAIQWWNLPDDQIQKYANHFEDAVGFIEAYEA